MTPGGQRRDLIMISKKKISAFQTPKEYITAYLTPYVRPVGGASVERECG